MELPRKGVKPIPAQPQVTTLSLLNKPRRSRSAIGSALFEAAHEELFRALFVIAGQYKYHTYSHPRAYFFSLLIHLFFSLHPSALIACLFACLLVCLRPIYFLFTSFGLLQSCKSRINYFLLFTSSLIRVSSNHGQSNLHNRDDCSHYRRVRVHVRRYTTPTLPSQ